MVNEPSVFELLRFDCMCKYNLIVFACTESRVPYFKLNYMLTFKKKKQNKKKQQEGHPGPVSLILV